VSARSFRRERLRAIRREERRSISRTKKVATAAGGLFAAAAVVAPAAQADFTVNSAADPGTGGCNATECTLREAVDAANATGPADVITFADGLTGPIQLADSEGSITITKSSLEIRGPGADKLSIVGPSNDRIFKIFGFPTGDHSVKISGLTLTGGHGRGALIDSGEGGAIYSLGDAGGDSSCDGFAAALTLDGDTVKDNNSVSAGGGVAVTQDYLCSSDETAKAAVSKQATGAGSLTVQNTTFSGNSASGDGGGIAIGFNAGSFVMENSTVAGNDAGVHGGGVSVGSDNGPPRSKSARLVALDRSDDINNSTVAGNSADSDGGGIWAVEGFHVGLISTIAGDNTAPSGPDLANEGGGGFTTGYSLVEDPGTAQITESPSGSNINGQDAQLGALQNNGGPTETKLPATSSPAIDTGIGNSLATDQRGGTFARTVDRDPTNVTDGTDIGAVEIPPDPPVETTTTTTTTTTEPEPTPIPAPATQLCLGKQVILTKGTDADESLTGTGVDDGILGSGGVDTIEGLSGDDCLFGQVGNDLVEGGPGNDNANGDRDNDVVNGDDGADSVRGQNGNDKVDGGPGDDPKVTGGAGDDKVKGGDGDDFVKGDGGNDVIDLGPGQDFTHSGGGADEIFAADGEKDKIICGTGKDVAHVDPIDDVDKDCNTVDVVK
jgi:CSLREA domain-containing protein